MDDTVKFPGVGNSKQHGYEGRRRAVSVTGKEMKTAHLLDEERLLSVACSVMG